MHGRGGLITASVDGPGGPILAGDHRRRDRPRGDRTRFTYDGYLLSKQAESHTISPL